MKKDNIVKIRTALNPSYKGKILKKGSWIAISSLLFLVICGIYLPPASLNSWGLPIFLFAMAITTVGLLPFRRLTRLETYPDEIWIINDQRISIYSGNKPLLEIPLSLIKEIKYIENSDFYGIGINLTENQSNTLETIECSPRFDLRAFQVRCRSDVQCDLFFRYFSKAAYEKLDRI